MPDFYYKRTCPECGGIFVAEDRFSWAYRVGSHTGGDFVCSYHCMRAYEKRHGLRRIGDPRDIEEICKALGCEA